jgi:hypothetical protein
VEPIRRAPQKIPLSRDSWVNAFLLYAPQETRLREVKVKKLKNAWDCMEIRLVDGPHFVKDCVKHFRVLDNQVGERFAVEVDASFLEAVNERVVGKSAKLNCFGNTRDPERSEIAFAVAASFECVFACMKICFFGDGGQPPFGHPIAFVGSEQFIVFGS